MTQYKELYGGFYIRNNGRWFWKANSESEEVGPISGFWLMQKIKEANNKTMKPIEFAKLPEEPKQEVAPEVKVEVKSETPKKTPSKKPAQKKPATETPVADTTENKEATN